MLNKQVLSWEPCELMESFIQSITQEMAGIYHSQMVALVQDPYPDGYKSVSNAGKCVGAAGGVGGAEGMLARENRAPAEVPGSRACS